MPPSAHAALVISIIASALGALVMCLLVARYGLTPAASENADAAARRLMITRFGHAFAGVCFVATGVLGVVTVIVQSRHARPTPPPAVVVQPDRAAEARLQALAAELKGIATRVEQTETRVSTMDSAARRLGDDVTSVNVRTRQLERAVAALPRRIAAPAPPTEAREAPAPREVPIRSPERPAAAPVPAPIEVPAVTPPPMPEPAAAPRSSPPAMRAPEPPRPPAPAARAPEPSVSARSMPTAARATEALPPLRSSAPPGRATVEAPPRGTEGGAAAAKREDLGDKLRDDWKTIRDGFSTAGDDLKAAVKDLGRKLWR
jgi:hypothetical protein